MNPDVERLSTKGVVIFDMLPDIDTKANVYPVYG
jgi:hypothetical protein